MSWTSRWTTWPASERKRLETIEKELADVRRQARPDLATSWRRRPSSTWPTSPQTASRDHKERQERLESAAEGCEGNPGSQRRAVLDDVEDDHSLRPRI